MSKPYAVMSCYRTPYIFTAKHGARASDNVCFGVLSAFTFGSRHELLM